MTQLKKNSAVISAFKYDGDGNRILETTGGVTTAYLGNTYEWTSGGAKSYYYAGNVRVAMRDSTSVRYLLGDHLGSTALTTDQNGARQAELRYFPYGKTRYTSGTTPTTYRFTGQRQQTNANELCFYNARWYDPLVGRFLSADTIVPDPQNPQSLNCATNLHV